MQYIIFAGGDKLVEVMTVASVPSTLVKCLYLFFDLAATEGEEEESSGPASSSPEHEAEFTARERRILLQKMFMQVLLRLCGHKVINFQKIFLRFKIIEPIKNMFRGLKIFKTIQLKVFACRRQWRSWPARMT